MTTISYGSQQTVAMIRGELPPAEPMHVEHYTGLNRTPALRVALEGWLDMMERGHAADTIVVQWDHEALVAFAGDGTPAGVLTYAHIGHTKSLAVCVGYVRPTYRRQGVYALLWDALVARAREVGAVVIDSSTMLDNSGMRATAAAQGRVETSVNLRFNVPA